MLDTPDGYFLIKGSLNLGAHLVIPFMSDLRQCPFTTVQYKQMHVFTQLGKGALFSTSATQEELSF